MNRSVNETSEYLNFDPNKSDSNDSEWGLEIVIKSTPKKRRRKSIDAKDKEIIDEVEKDIEDTLEEKAAKSNLSHSTVKSILKHVFTDEHVLALVKQKEGCEDVEGIIPYEPKITRSKARELYSNSGSNLNLPWQTPTPTSEVHALLNEDLQEDSSGDDYVPGEEESEDDSFTCSISNPPTPAVSLDTHKHEDEIFKTPKSKEKKQSRLSEEDEATIALRTRSKFSLSQTPLEKIEQAFIPPDITTDMYEMDCKDEDWREFLKSFTQPLDEVVKLVEDEEQDPEYNVLEDEEINEVDKEELRADKAVKVPKKELNDLIAEVFEYVDIYSKQTEHEQLAFEPTFNSAQTHHHIIEDCIQILDSTITSNMPYKDCQVMSYEEQLNKEQKRESEQNLNLKDMFSQSQLLLLEQQMRQHVQMLTQNFLLAYRHPFYDNMSLTFEEYLFNIKFLSEGKENSVFKCTNLEGALKLIEKWKDIFFQGKPDAKEMIEHINETMLKSINCHTKGQYYHLPFPPLILKTVSDCDVFLYPYLLPKIPFKHPDLLRNDGTTFSYSEYQLIALGLDQFVPQYMNDVDFITNKKQLSMKKLSEVIHSIMMPGRKSSQIYNQIIKKKKEENLPNPITYYFIHKKAPSTIHQVNPLNYFQVVPPRKRPPALLPRQWRHYIWPTDEQEEDLHQLKDDHNLPHALVVSHPKEDKRPKVLPKLLKKCNSPKNDLHSKNLRIIQQLKEERTRAFNLSPKNLERSLKNIKKKFIRCFRRTVTYLKYYSLRRTLKDYTNVDMENRNISSKEVNNALNMLPSMPCLNLSNRGMKKDIKIDNEDEQVKQLELISKESIAIGKNEPNRIEIKSTVSIDINDSDKDNLDEINALMVASSSIKNVREKKELSSLADKKKAKKRKEFLASLAMLSAPDPETEKDRREQFAQAYFEKMKEVLDSNDYEKVRLLFLNVDTIRGDGVDLFKKLKPILFPKYKDLLDEFLLFLNAEQANAVGKLIPFFIMNHMAKFVRNLEIYFKDQPSQLRKIHKSLFEVSDGSNITLDKVKSTILPLLRGNPLLCDGFLQIFLEESPTATLLNGAWEVIDINKESNNIDEEASFESIVVSDNEDHTCTCSCHKIDEQQPLKQHCINCGIRFIQGRVYCQTAKGLRPVNISFPPDPDIDHKARLAAQSRSKRSDHSPSKRLSSPSKELQYENRRCYAGEVKMCKSPRKTKSKQKKLSVITKNKDMPNKMMKRESPRKNIEKLSGVKASPSSGRNRVRSLKISVMGGSIKNEDKSDNEKAAKSSSSSERINTLTDLDFKDLPSPEYMCIPSSDSDFSTDEASESTISRGKSFGKEQATSELWTRDEDKIILETFQQSFDQEAIQLIAKQLKNRSVDAIRTRFEKLMALLQEMES